jgi:hypothetical protein
MNIYGTARHRFTRNHPAGKGRLTLKADSLTAIYDPNI